jgi:predicted secreted Zn-dependent protease
MHRVASRWAALLAVASLAVGCALPPPGTSQPSTPASPAAPARSPTAATPAPNASIPESSPSPVAELLPISGTWRVRKVLSPHDQSGLIDNPTFDDETFTVAADCPAEPCDEVEVTTTPLGLSSPATVVRLVRQGATYASKAEPTQATTCVTSTGDRVDGGATATSTLHLWVATDRPSGSSVASTLLHGRMDLDLKPTDIGRSAGCEPQTASFDLTGRREEVAVRDPDGGPAIPDADPPRGATLVRLPTLSPKVSGATVKYFAVTGDTSIELVASVGRGGVKACGMIDYEWYRGDARPSACTITRVTDLRASIRTSTSSAGTCRITRAAVTSSYVIHLPRWTEPDRVPKRLLDWWRRIVDFIADHEAGHVRIGLDYMKRLNSRLLGKPCEDVTAIVRSWARQHAEAQEGYDMVEYDKPWPRPAAGY